MGSRDGIGVKRPLAGGLRGLGGGLGQLGAPPGDRGGGFGGALESQDPRRLVGGGSDGTVGGQVLDIQAQHQDIDLLTLQNIHKQKTGMLIRAAVRMGAIAGGANDRQLDDLTGYAEDIGLAFQIADDVLNVTGTREELGKNPNTDAERGKKTYPTFYGVEGAKQLADACVSRAIDRLSSFGSTADPLREIARYITSRRS